MSEQNQANKPPEKVEKKDDALKAKNPSGKKSLKDQTVFIKGFGPVVFKKDQELEKEHLAALEKRKAKVAQYFK